MGGAGALSPQGSETVYYVKAAVDKGQYKILPVVMTVLIDQDRVQDFLVELENSPMSIQVMDFELARPTARVEKPEKGTGAAGGGMGVMGMMAMMGNSQVQAQRMMQQMVGGGAYGGMASMMQNQMMSRMGMMGGMGNMMGAGTNTPKRTGKDVRGKDTKKARKEKQEAAEQAKGPSLFDPYFDIVQVTIYGQARFFNPPPTDAATEPSPGESVPAPVAAASPTSPAGPAATKGTAAQNAATPAEPDQKSAAAKAADRAAAGGEKDEDADKTAPKAADGAGPAADDEGASGKAASKGQNAKPPEGDDDDAAVKPAPKADSATKPRPSGAGAKP
jgi:hypothetical protein